MYTKLSLKRIFRILALLTLVVALFGCMPNVVVNPGLPDVVVRVPSSTTTTMAAPAGNADAHYIQPTDYFFQEESNPNAEWAYIKIGKLVTPPTPETKNQAQFMNVSSGINEWAKWWTQSRIATRADLKLGTEVIFFDMGGEGETYRAPESNQEARSYSWCITRITDVSELFKGYVMVGGGYKIQESNLRVLVK